MSDSIDWGLLRHHLRLVWELIMCVGCHGLHKGLDCHVLVVLVVKNNRTFTYRQLKKVEKYFQLGPG